jgi:intracellular multiplication protein IcmO
MLEAISCAGTTESVDPGLPANPISAETMRMLMAIETLASGNPHAARRDSLAGLAERDRARDGRTAPMRPSPMQGAELEALINQLTDRLAA